MRDYIILFDYSIVRMSSEGNEMMEREQEQQLYRMQAELCQTLADPTRLEVLYLLRDEPKAVKDLVELLGQRQAKVSQHLALLRQRGIVRAERVGNVVYLSNEMAPDRPFNDPVSQDADTPDAPCSKRVHERSRPPRKQKMMMSR